MTGNKSGLPRCAIEAQEDDVLCHEGPEIFPKPK